MEKSGKVRDIPGMEYHPKSSDANPEALERLAGIIQLTGPVPSWRFMEDEDDEDDCGPEAHARD